MAQKERMIDTKHKRKMDILEGKFATKPEHARIATTGSWFEKKTPQFKRGIKCFSWMGMLLRMGSQTMRQGTRNLSPPARMNPGKAIASKYFHSN